jgi:hypothetical protein
VTRVMSPLTKKPTKDGSLVVKEKSEARDSPTRNK